MTLPRLWGCLFLLAAAASIVLAPAGDWSYALADGFHVVRGPTSVGNAPILTFPRNPPLEGVRSIATVQSETRRGDTILSEELGAIGEREQGFFIVRQDAGRPWLFTSEAAWRAEALTFHPSFERDLRRLQPAESLPLPTLRVEALDVLAQSETAIVGRTTTRQWFVVTKAHQRLERFTSEADWTLRAAAVFPGYSDRLFPGHGGIRNHARNASILSALLLLTWPLVVFLGKRDETLSDPPDGR